MELAQGFLIRYAECYVLIRFNFAAAVINTFVSSKAGEKLKFLCKRFSKDRNVPLDNIT